MGREARANQTAVDEIAPFLLSIPIAKVDKEQRLVTGVVTAEVLDKQGDIVDYETAKKFFTDEDLWPGNMREMHQPKAVGKRITVECDDANKTISVTSRVSKGAPDTWEKILDGTLSMHSIGGSGKRVAEKVDGKIAKRLYLEQLAEVSYVDNGACPAAKFDIVKTVDGKLTDAEPADPVEDDIQDPVAKAAAAVDAAIEATKPPVYVAGSVRKLVAGLARATDRAVQKDAVIAQATAAGAEAIAELPLTWQPEAVRKGSPEPWDIDRALSAISVLENLLSTEYYDAMYSQAAGTPPDPVKVAQVAAIKAAIDAVIRFLVSEHEEQFSADAAGNGGLAVDAVVEMFVKSLDFVQKAGARHSKNDNEMIQKVHDLSGSLGAACKDMDEGDTEKILKFVGGEKVSQVLKNAGYLVPGVAVLQVAEPIEAIQKLTVDLETTKFALSESQAGVAKQAETLAALATRLESLEKLPAGGGPVRNAQGVDKALGGPGGGESPATADDVVKALQAVADGASEPTVKAAIAMQIAKLSHNHPIALSPR